MADELKIKWRRVAEGYYRYEGYVILKHKVGKSDWQLLFGNHVLHYGPTLHSCKLAHSRHLKESQNNIPAKKEASHA